METTPLRQQLRWAMHTLSTRSPHTGLSGFYRDDYAEEISILTRHLRVTPIQAVFIALFFERRDRPVDLYKLYDQTCTYYARWRDEHFDAIDALIEMGYIIVTVRNNRQYHQLNPDAIESILRGDPFNPNPTPEPRRDDVMTWHSSEEPGVTNDASAIHSRRLPIHNPFAREAQEDDRQGLKPHTKNGRGCRRRPRLSSQQLPRRPSVQSSSPP